MITNIRWVAHDIVYPGKNKNIKGYTLQVRVHDGKEESDWADVPAVDRYRGAVVPYMLGIVDIEVLT